MAWTTVIELDCDGEPCWSGPLRLDTGIKETAIEQAIRYHGWSHDPETDEHFCRKCTKIREGQN